MRIHILIRLTALFILIGTVASAMAQVENITAGEYFFDNAGTPEGTGTPLSVTAVPAPLASATATIDVSGLSAGPHVLYIRYQDDNGDWGSPVVQPFVVPDELGIVSLGTAELFIDVDPGQGTATGLATGTGTQPQLTFADRADVTSSGAGAHTVGMRVQDSRGDWSQVIMQPFVGRAAADYRLNAINRAEFFIDADPGLDRGTALPLAPLTPLGVAAQGDETVDVTALTRQPHTISARVADAFGVFSFNIVQSLNTRDLDMDGFIDLIDVFPLDPTEWRDTDSDGIGNNTDNDIDGDMVPNVDDLDDDGDMIPDDDEIAIGLDPNDHVDGEFDTDRDGLTGLEEFGLGTDPNNPDTDGDSIADGLDPTPLIVGLLDAVPTPDGIDEGDRYGESVAVSGNRVAVGAPGDEGGGTVFVFRLEGGEPILEESIQIPRDYIGAELGASVAIEGDVLVAGAPGMSPGAKFDDKGGSIALLQAAIFQRVNSQWQLKDPLVGQGGNGNDRFGESVAIDGDMVVIGAPDDAQDEASGNGSGAAYIFDQSGNSVALVDKFKSPLATPGARFGAAVDTDDQHVAVGAPGGMVGDATTGSLSLYQLVADNLTNLDTVVGSGAANDARFGNSVSLVGDQIAVGAPGEDSTRGAAYLFTVGAASVSERARIVAESPASGDEFGMAVGLGSDRLIVGAPGMDNGAAFEYDASNLDLVHRFDAPSGQVTFGMAVGLSNDRIAVGAPMTGAQGASALQRDVRIIFKSDFE